jgi:hypothetical protein
MIMIRRSIFDPKGGLQCVGSAAGLYTLSHHFDRREKEDALEGVSLDWISMVCLFTSS